MTETNQTMPEAAREREFRSCSLGEMEDFLIKRNPRQYLSFLNNWKNAGHPRLAVRYMEGYRAGEDLILLCHMVFQGDVLYFEIAEEPHFAALYERYLKRKEVSTEFLLSSDNGEVFRSEGFRACFGDLAAEPSEQYAMFRDSVEEPDSHIRLLDDRDAETAASFPDDPHYPYLGETFGYYLSSDRRNDRFYGYFDHGALLGYLHANTFDGCYWDVGYLYTASAARRRGIAVRLSKAYAFDTVRQGGFASYGTPVTEGSRRTALGAGFERFEKTWSTVWLNSTLTRPSNG